MLLRRLSLGLFIIPSVTIILCLITTIYLNILDLCNPFINGCYSISRVGRSYPAVLLFKPMMIITIILMIAYFFEHYRIFKKFLLNKIYLVYIIFLGVEGSEIWRFMRRGGIFIYIISLIISQFLIILTYLKIKNDYQVIISSKIININFCYNVLLITCGIIIILLIDIFSLTTSWYVKNIIQWNYFLLMNLFFLNTYFIWKKLDK
ncbi:MAG: hypothetical protein RL305_281 [Pseudomonadota bacterium]